MSKLYGTLQGSRGKATRCGHDELTTIAASWNGAIQVDIWIDRDGTEHYRVARTEWQGSGGPTVVLAEGTLNQPQAKSAA